LRTNLFPHFQGTNNVQKLHQLLGWQVGEKLFLNAVAQHGRRLVKAAVKGIESIQEQISVLKRLGRDGQEPPANSLAATGPTPLPLQHKKNRKTWFAVKYYRDKCEELQLAAAAQEQVSASSACKG
jgi:hypothetical protein